MEQSMKQAMEKGCKCPACQYKLTFSMSESIKHTLKPYVANRSGYGVVNTNRPSTQNWAYSGDMKDFFIKETLEDAHKSAQLYMERIGCSDMSYYISKCNKYTPSISVEHLVDTIVGDLLRLGVKDPSSLSLVETLRASGSPMVNELTGSLNSVFNFWMNKYSLDPNVHIHTDLIEVKRVPESTVNNEDRPNNVSPDPSEDGIESITIGGVYRHFKGGIYRVLAVSKHTETGEVLVVYVGIEGPNKGDVYSRPIDMFLSNVDKDKYPEVTQVKRLELCSDYEG